MSIDSLDSMFDESHNSCSNENEFETIKKANKIILSTPKDFEFPFKPYSIQLKLMKSLYETIENGNIGIFESPTGTGKTLSIICSCIRWYQHDLIRRTKQIENSIDQIKSLSNNEQHDWLNQQLNNEKYENYINVLKDELETLNHINDKHEKIKHFSPKSKKAKLLEPNDTLEDFMIENDYQELASKLYDKNKDNEDKTVKRNRNQIFYCTRTHSQINQFIQEIEKTNLKISLTVLGSRQHLCIHPKISKISNHQIINEKCLLLNEKNKKSKACKFMKNLDYMSEIIRNKIMNVTELIKTGKESNICPYYSTRKALDNVDVVVMSYNNLLHDKTRESIKINLNNSVVIFDEAHNIIDAILNAYSINLGYTMLLSGQRQLELYFDKYEGRFNPANHLHVQQLINVIKGFRRYLENKETSTNLMQVSEFLMNAKVNNFNLFDLVKFMNDSNICRKILGFNVEKSKNTEIDANEKINVNQNNAIMTIKNFIESICECDNNSRVIVAKFDDVSESNIKYIILSPTSKFEKIVKECRSIIFCGGTMNPCHDIKNELLLKNDVLPSKIVQYTCDHVVDPKNVCCLVVPKSVNQRNFEFNYKSRHDKRYSYMIEDLYNSIYEIVKWVPGGCVVFFSSYSFLEKVFKVSTDQKQKIEHYKHMLCESKNSSENVMIWRRYSNYIDGNPKKGAVLFCVMGGKMSEGINFSDNLARCIIIVGLPFANIKSVELNGRIDYLNTNL
ncbi:hypothetical protein A3Q56_05276, partial [Intoshia linei]